MHGSKKWIKRHDGRWKRSRHRISPDWRAGRPNDSWHECDDCKAGSRVFRYGVECFRCRRLRHHPQHGAYYRTKWWVRVSADDKRAQLREYRAEVRDLMQRGKYDPEMYNLIPPLRRDYLD